MAVARSHRCSLCGTGWPYDERFKKCVACGGRTWIDHTPPTVSVEDALKVKAEVDFEAYYEEKCRREMAEAADKLAISSPLFAGDFTA